MSTDFIDVNNGNVTQNGFGFYIKGVSYRVVNLGNSLLDIDWNKSNTNSQRGLYGKSFTQCELAVCTDSLMDF